MKIFKKIRYPNGRRHIYFLGVKVFSYKRKVGKQHRLAGCGSIAQQTVRYCANDRLHLLLRDRFYERTGKLPTEKLTTFAEKVIWASMFDVTPLKIQCADKLAVRDYVEQTIGKKYLPELYASYTNSDDFDIQKLPNSFVLTFNAGSGQNMVITDKNKYESTALKQIIKEWLLYNHSELFCEMQYRYIKPCVIAREMLDIRTDVEYKLWCFAGRVEFIVINNYRDGHDNIRVKTKSRDWQDLGFRQTCCGFVDEIDENVSKPDFLAELIEISEMLAKPFDFVRVDFYETKDGKLKFGELTFSPTAGSLKYTPDNDKIQKHYGDLFKIPPRDEYGFAVRTDAIKPKL